MVSKAKSQEASVFRQKQDRLFCFILFILSSIPLALLRVKLLA